MRSFKPTLHLMAKNGGESSVLHITPLNVVAKSENRESLCHKRSGYAYPSPQSAKIPATIHNCILRGLIQNFPY